MADTAGSGPNADPPRRWVRASVWRVALIAAGIAFTLVPHKSSTMDAKGVTVESSAWQTKLVKDQMTDKPRLEATTEAVTEQTQYKIDYKCDEAGERLGITTFDRNGAGKPLKWRRDLAIALGVKILPFRARIDSGVVQVAVLAGGDYFNAGSMLLNGCMFGGECWALPMAQARSLVIGDIFENEQFTLAIDFPQQFRNDCERLIRPLPDDLQSESQRAKKDKLDQGAAAFNNRGVAYRNKGDYDRAIADYDQAIRLDPENAFAFYNRGSAYFDKGDYDHAIADLNEADRLHPQDARVFISRGNAYRGKGNYSNAILDYDEAIRLNPRDSVAFNNRGIAYGNKGDFDRAIVDLTEAIQLNPRDSDAFASRGFAYYKKGDYDRAIVDLNEAIRLDPKLTEALNLRAEVLARRGRR